MRWFDDRGTMTKLLGTFLTLSIVMGIVGSDGGVA
jgi:hypothetical protein